MNAVAPVRGTWDKVEFYTSYFLLIVLVTVIGMRLSFDTVWQMPKVDLMLSVIALVLVVAGLSLGGCFVGKGKAPAPVVTKG